MFSRRLVEGSDSKAEGFRRVLELTQEVFLPTPVHKKLTAFVFLLLCFLLNIFKHFFISGITPDPKLSPRVVSLWM